MIEIRFWMSYYGWMVEVVRMKHAVNARWERGLLGVKIVTEDRCSVENAQ